MKTFLSRVAVLLISLNFSLILEATDTFRIAAYNVENYLDQPTATRKNPKSAAAKAKIRQVIHAMAPDVIAFEEMGDQRALLELRDSLKAEGLDFPHWEHLSGWDTNIHLAVLSRFPITARHPHTNDTFLLSGKRFSVSRGFIELDIRVNTNYSFTLFSAHLKSKRTVPEADEAELRLEEARLLREHVETRLTANPAANIVVLGDFNDTYNTAPIKAIIGRGKNKLEDTRPAERNGDADTNPVNPHFQPRNISWTHYYGAEDSYSRIDYLLLSPGMANEWIKKETYIPTVADWGLGSDHRPVLATFSAKDN